MWRAIALTGSTPTLKWPIISAIAISATHLGNAQVHRLVSFDRREERVEGRGRILVSWRLKSSAKTSCGRPLLPRRRLTPCILKLAIWAGQRL